MNYKSLDSYLLALVMLEDKNREQELQGSLATIKQSLSVKLRIVCKANNINIVKQINKIWKRFVDMSSDGDYEISQIMLALQLIILNPNRDKHKTLTSLALEVAKEHRFSGDIQIKNSKKLVYRFIKGE